ncbi:MAG: flagellar type III secretion system protein FlhB [bacterium]
MSAPDDDTEREHEPSQRRLDEARKRGDVPRSADLVSAAVYAGFALAFLLAGDAAIRQAGSAAMVLIGQSERLAPLTLQSSRAPMAGVLASFALPFLPMLLLPMIAALLAAISQRSLIFSPEKLAPKLSRISPVKSFGQKFGRDGLFAFGKSFLKLCVTCLLGAILVSRHANEVLLSLQVSPGQSMLLMFRILLQFVLLAFLSLLIFGGFDYGWQYLQHRRRNRMSRQEMIDEHKESDGDPHMKGHRRQRGREIAMSQMLSDVAKADVILVNPTHYAVALKWKRGDRTAPLCLAKGVDDVAARIREKAAEIGVPIHRDPPTARAIFATVEVGSPIRPEHFKAVAAAIRFSEAMCKKAKSRR